MPETQQLAPTPTTDPAAEPAPAAQPQPQPQPQSPPATNVDDKLARLAYEQIPKFRDEVRNLPAPDVEDLRQTIQGTVMSLLQGLAVEVVRLRTWSIDSQAYYGEIINEQAARIEQLEGVTYGGDSQLTEEDATLFQMVFSACQVFAEQAQSADEQGGAKLEEVKQLVERAQARCNEITLIDDDDDDDEDDSDDGDDDAIN